MFFGEGITPNFVDDNQDEINNEKINRKLFSRIMDRIDGKEIFAKDVYLVEQSFHIDVFKRYGIYLNDFSKEKFYKIYLKHLKKILKFIDNYSLLVSYSGSGMESEIITGISLPRLEYLVMDNLFSTEFTTSPYVSDGEKKYFMQSTNFFSYGEKKKVNTNEIEDYIKFFLVDDNYDVLLQFLLINLESGVFFNNPVQQPYLPKELISYYNKEFFFGKRDSDITKHKAIEKIRKK